MSTYQRCGNSSKMILVLRWNAPAARIAWIGCSSTSSLVITILYKGRSTLTVKNYLQKIFFFFFFSKNFIFFFFSGSVEFTTVPAAGGGGVISNTAVPGMSSSSDVTITRAPNAHGGAPGGVHAQSSLGNGFASQVQPTSLGQKIFDRPNKDKVK